MFGQRRASSMKLGENFVLEEDKTANKRNSPRLTQSKHCSPSLRIAALAGAASFVSLIGATSIAYAQSITTNTMLPDDRSMPVTPQPGQVFIRLGGHINFYAADFAFSGDKGTAGKTANYGFSEYVHLNPSVDGVAANGLKYGAFVDIWQEKPGNAAVSGQSVGGGAGGGISSSDRYFGTMYVRRQYTYIGSDSFGTLRLGVQDPVSSLYEAGTFENFNDGGWNGDIGNLTGGNSQPTWPFGFVGNLYTPTKITYLSPQINGFEAGVTFEPSTAEGGYFANSNVPSSGSANLTSSNVPGDLARRRDMIDVHARYRGTFGPVGVAIEGGWMGSDHVNPDGITGTYINYKGFNQALGGATVTVAGFTFGGHFMAGDFNGQWGLNPAHAPISVAYSVGGTYTTGPIIAGVQAFHYNSTGNSYQGNASVGQMTENGLAVGATYSLAPGLSVFLDYLYGTRKENGYDLLNSVAGSRDNNYVQSQLIGVGTQLRW